jgi:hypothetical protein
MTFGTKVLGGLTYWSDAIFRRCEPLPSNAPLDIFKSLRRSHLNWNRRLQAADPNDESLVRNIGSYIRYLKTEMDGIRKRWLEVEKK